MIKKVVIYFVKCMTHTDAYGTVAFVKQNAIINEFY